ncbi:hypothetical protein [Streptomyces sp. NPDC001404]
MAMTTPIAAQPCHQRRRTRAMATMTAIPTTRVGLLLFSGGRAATE